MGPKSRIASGARSCGCDWVRELGEDATNSLDSGSLLSVAWTGDAYDQILDAIEHHRAIWFRGATADGGRGFRVRGWAGGLTLSSIGTRVSLDGWRAELAALVACLRDHAPAITYAFIARGFDAWPRRRNDRPRGPVNTPDAFDDRYVPDASDQASTGS